MNKENENNDGMVESVPIAVEEKKKSELMVFGNTNTGALQKNFDKFRKAKKDEIKYRSEVLKLTKSDRSQEFKDTLRAKFVETAKKYFGVPYAKRYHQPGDEHYSSPIFLDCCALVRQVVYDLREEFGFQLDRWNQAYQVDTLPITLTLEQMKPGDLIFYSGTYFNTKLRAQKHDMVHVEIFTGGETGEQSIGARWQKGVVKYFDSFKFTSTSYHSIQFHFRSLETWLDGICRSHCDQHKWSGDRLNWAPGKNSIFAMEDGYDEADLDAPLFDDEGDVEETKVELEKLSFFGAGNNPKLAKDTLVNLGFQVMPHGMQFNEKYRFKWVQTPAEINYIKFVEGRNICNHFSNSAIFTRKISTLEQLDSLNMAMRSRHSEISTIYKSTKEFTPQTFRLDIVADLVQFLNQPNTGLWMVKHSNSNQGKGVEMVKNIAQYKDDLLTRKDKWGDNTPVDSTEILLNKLDQELGEAQAKEVVKKSSNLNILVKELKDVVVQRYIENPCLIRGRKFDIRSFMVIICSKPYFVYAHPGYARISLNQFSCDDFGEKNQSARCTHLTNLAIQKKHPDFKSMKNDTTMSSSELCDYLISEGKVANSSEFRDRVTLRINEVMRLMFLQIKDKLDRKFGCFEMFGFDFILDHDLSPKLLEVNINPAMFLDTKTLENMLPTLVKDACQLAVGIHEPFKTSSSTEKIQASMETTSLPYDILYLE